MTPTYLYDKWFETYYGSHPGPPSPPILHGTWGGKSYFIDPKAMKAHDLSKKSSHWGAAANATQVPPNSSFYHLMMQEMAYFYGSFDPLQGTPWGAAADRFEEAVAAAGTELEWR